MERVLEERSRQLVLPPEDAMPEAQAVAGGDRSAAARHQLDRLSPSYAGNVGWSAISKSSHCSTPARQLQAICRCFTPSEWSQRTSLSLGMLSLACGNGFLHLSVEAHPCSVAELFLMN